MIRICLLGGLSVHLPEQRTPAATTTQPRRLAVLAIIAHAGDRGVSRDRLQALLWPDAPEDSARRGLTQALYALRTGLDSEQLLVGIQDLRLNRDVATCDVLEYSEAIASGELERAAALYRGPFLDGFRVPGAAEFQRRIEELRDELTRRHESLVERLAVRATERGEGGRAADWWRQRAAMDPLNARVAEAYMRALAATGDRVAAIRHARIHEQLVTQEFGSGANTALAALAEQFCRELETASAPAAEPVAIMPAPAAIPTAPTTVPTPVSTSVPVPVPVPVQTPSPTAPPADVRVPTPMTPVDAASVLRRATDASALPKRWSTTNLVRATAAIAILAAIALAISLRPKTQGRMDAADLQALRISAPQRIASDDVFELDAAISPDGRQIAYVAGEEGAMRVFVRLRDGSQAIAVAEAVGGDQRRPRWSPDGSQLTFQAARGLWVAPSLGGTARQVVEPTAASSSSAISPEWSPDGRELAWAMGDSIYRMPVTGGGARAVAGVPSVHSLAWSPDGRFIAAVSGNVDFMFGAPAERGKAGLAIGNLAPSAIVLVRADSVAPRVGVSERTRVLMPATALNMSPAWLDTRTLVFVSKRSGARDLFTAHITDDGALRGDPERLSVGLDAHSVSVSLDGRQLSYAVFRQSSNVWSIPLRPDTVAVLASATRVTRGTQVVEGFDVSPDGQWLAYDADASGQQDIYRLALRNGVPAGDAAQRIVSSPVDDFHPSWSPDAQWIAYYTFRDNVRRAAYVSAGGGPSRFVHTGGANVEEHSPIWNATGTSLFYFRTESARINLFRADRLNDSTWTDSRRITSLGGYAASFTIDGRQMAFFSAPGTIRVADSSLSEGTSRVLVSPQFAKQFGLVAESGRIAPDGRGLIVKGRDAKSSGFWWVPIANGNAGKPQLLVRFDDPRRDSPRSEFASDGRHLFFALAEREADVWAVRLDQR